MDRRNFIRASTLSTLALSMAGCVHSSKTHILSLSFDDGFRKSFIKTAKIHEEYGLKACLNIIAAAHMGINKGPYDYHKDPVGDFDDWNQLKERGHEIMPHTWAHNKLTKIPYKEATDLMDKCLDYFEDHLEGFETSKAVFNFSYNASNTQLENYVLKRVLAIRTFGWTVLEDNKVNNPFPGSGGPVRLGCWTFGPGNADEWTEIEINKFLESDGGWLILNLHGLDDEGWGPVSSDYLDKLLNRLIRIENLDVLPVGMALEKYA